MAYVDEQYELIRAAQDGDRDAVSRLVSIHTRELYSLLLYLCGNRSLAEDLTQETFLRALQALKKYQFRAPFRAWLFRIAVNLYRDERRRHQVRKPVEHDVSDEENMHLYTADPGPDAVAEHNEQVQALHKALALLPRTLRTVVVMRDLQELSYTEIGEALGWPTGTVKSRLFRARKELAALLQPFMEEPS
ncbi:MAG TPA: sigma-70 family RNA polymerase sigma factor [bacterium]|nr:sigma-70 family RNA polymerase sigma factor [bacterium]HQG45938.1 sigma-70 family RNA polymerase sigma factor [bacterium]HQI50194.1 sigma-70 family RNA polymerase sigma factor [bacterium]HQJ64832.1 sigma-70 family RNA polymerase sigma factor [bacterium]